MKTTLSNCIGKLVCLSFFVLNLIFVSGIHAQSNAAKSTNITTINGKKYYLHKVAHAQSLYGIAKIYGVEVNTILSENPGASKGIVVGQDLRIPYNGSSNTSTTKTTEESKKTEEVK